MSWLDLAVRVIPDSLLQRAKALQETLRFEQVEKERQARLGEEIKQRVQGKGNGKGESQRQGTNGKNESSLFGRQGPSKSIERRPIGAGAPSGGFWQIFFGYGIAYGWIEKDLGDFKGWKIYSGDGQASMEFAADVLTPPEPEGFTVFAPNTYYTYHYVNPPGFNQGPGDASLYPPLIEDVGWDRTDEVTQFDQQDKQLVIPTGGDTMLVLLSRRSEWRRMQARSTCRTTQTGEIIDEFPGADMYVKYRLSYEGSASIVSLPSYTYESSSVQAAFYVTRTSVQQLTIPESLTDFFSGMAGPSGDETRAFSPGSSDLPLDATLDDETIPWIRGTTYLGEYTYYAAQCLNGYYEFWTREPEGEGSDPPVYNMELTRLPRSNYLVWSQDTRDIHLGWLSNNEIAPALMNGLGELETDYHAGSQAYRYGTPSAISFLEAGGQSLNGTLDYSDIPSSYGTPPYWLSVKLDVTNYRSYRFKQFDNPGSFYSEVGDEGRPFDSLTIFKPYSVPTFGNSIIMAWDWWQAEACRQRVLNLGFQLP
jgi:hypothetical protein